MEERRNEPRAKSKVKRTVVGTVEHETFGALSTHLYIMDISENGIRLNLDREIEPESTLRLVLPLRAFGYGLEGEFEAQCRVVWTKALAGGTCILGMEFQNLVEPHKQSLSEIIDHWSGKQAMELESLPEPVNAKFRFSEDDPWSRTIGIRAISHDGFKFPYGKEMEVGDELQIRILLEAGTVENRSVIRWCKPLPNRAFDIGCEFQNLGKGDAGYIDLHLRRCRHRPINPGR